MRSTPTSQRCSNGQRVTLPCRRFRGAVHGFNCHGNGETVSRGRIVVADDSSVNRMLLCSMLQDAGYDVRAASDGREALALIETDPPELVLLDVQMPVMDGHAVCRELQR